MSKFIYSPCHISTEKPADLYEKGDTFDQKRHVYRALQKVQYSKLCFDKIYDFILFKPGIRFEGSALSQKENLCIKQWTKEAFSDTSLTYA